MVQFCERDLVAHLLHGRSEGFDLLLLLRDGRLVIFPLERSRVHSARGERLEKTCAERLGAFLTPALLLMRLVLLFDCTSARPPVSTFRLSASLAETGLSSPKVRRATVSIFSTCAPRERMESASIDARWVTTFSLTPAMRSR